MPIQKSKHNSRRQEIRRNIPPRPATGWARFQRREAGWAGFFVLAFALLGGVIAWAASVGPRYHVAELMDSPLVARTTFELVDREGTVSQQEAARALVPQRFQADAAYLEELRSRLTALLSLADQPFSETDTDLIRNFRLSRAGHAALARFARGQASASNPDLEQGIRAWDEAVDRVLARFFSQPLLDPVTFDGARAHPVGLIVSDPFRLEQRRVNFPAYRSVEDGEAVTAQLRQAVTPLPVPLRETAQRVLQRELRPTHVPDPQATAAARRVAAEAVQPIRIRFEPGDLMVQAGHRLTGEDVALLEAERAAVADRRNLGEVAAQRLAMGGVLGLLAAAAWLFLFQTHERVVRNPMRGLAVTLLLVGGQALAVVLSELFPGAPLGGVTFPTLAVAIVLAIVYDRALALTLGLLHALVVALTLRESTGLGLGYLVVMSTGVAAAVMPLREVRTRSKLVVIGSVAGLAMAAATLLVTSAEHPDLAVQLGNWRRFGSDIVAAIASGVAAGMILQGTLPLIERVFRVTTALTLRELNDSARPLLQRLAHEAPGTYQHSLRIADMAEAAADAVGADGLLCRVGAMYHDVGKINKPQYFIENQGGGPNRHNSLSPAMSLLIIVGHVKDGVQIAREYGLPRPLIHFIESHHGTSLVEYFFHAACKGSEASDKLKPEEFEYRYPGPKPRTREAAILLLCDGIEGAARALDEPTPARLRQITHNMAKKRLIDGQFDECGLTFAELSRIESAITKTLNAIYHSRIKYPTDTEPEAAAAG